MAKLIIFQNPYDTINAMENVVKYVLDRDKAYYVGAQNLLPDGYELQQIYAVRRFWNDNTKKKILHFLISFGEEFIAMDNLIEAAYKICSIFPEYQMLFAIHKNIGNLHVHMAVNPINMKTGRKLYFDNCTLFFFVSNLRDILKKYDIKVSCAFKDNNSLLF